MEDTQRLWDYFTSLPEDGDGWRVIPGGAAALSEKYGKDRMWSTQAIKRWRDTGRIEIRKAGPYQRAPIRAIRIIGTKPPTRIAGRESVDLPAIGSAKDRLLKLLIDTADERYYVRVSTRHLRKKLGLSAHDLMKYLFDLRAAGLIRFNTTGTGSTLAPTKIKVQARALAPRPADPDAPAGLGDHPTHTITNPARRAHRMGPDLLDPSTARRRQLEESSIVEVTPGTAVEQRGPSPVVQRLLREAVPEPTGRPSAAAESDRGTETPPATERPAPPVPYGFRPAGSVAATVPMPQEAIDDASNIMDARPLPYREAYPLITELLGREDQIEEAQDASKKLEALGLDDLALQTLEAFPALTPLEEEIASLIARAGLQHDWDKPGQTLRETIDRIGKDTDED